jgi:hypothetical protein
MTISEKFASSFDEGNGKIVRSYTFGYVHCFPYLPLPLIVQQIIELGTSCTILGAYTAAESTRRYAAPIWPHIYSYCTSDGGYVRIFSSQDLGILKISLDFDISAASSRFIDLTLQ